MDITDGSNGPVSRSLSPENPTARQAPASQPQQDTVSVRVEEGSDVYRPGGFHPVYIGDVYNTRYKVLNKIGYGTYSTVWIVEDLQGGYVRESFLTISSINQTQLWGPT